MKRVLKKALRVFIIILSIITVSLIVIGMAFAIYVDRYIEKSIDEEMFYAVGSNAQTKIYYYDYDGKDDRVNRIGEAIELSDAQIYGGYRCDFVDYNDIPKDLINAFISIEDKRFIKHNGVDWFRTLSAAVNYFLKFNGSYGGSTITQQLIKNVTENDEYSFQRKIQEIFWALDLETKMDKKEIMELYLNIINLSQGCYGVGAAADYYFSKDISQLSLSECACIAAITNSPTYYDPIRNHENNDKRRRLILGEMYKQGYIENEEYIAALDDEIELRVNKNYDNSHINSWYVDMVIEDVMSDLMEQYGYSRTMASLVVYTGGLQIYTVMDPDTQKILEAYYENINNFSPTSDEEIPQSSMIIIDSDTGDILGVAGAIGEKTGNRIQNCATSTLRPAGSVVKPLSTYAPSLEAGIINWASVYDDTPVNFGNYNLDESKGDIVQPSPWPKNANGIYRGLININYAIEHSINTVTVKVLQQLGLESSFDFLYNKLKMTSLIHKMTLDNGAVLSDKDFAALALGQFNYGVTVREITAAYSIFSNNGIYNGYRSYYKVTDGDDELVLDNSYRGEIVISEENSDLMTLMLQNVVKKGTASQISLQKNMDCAGKTGTTQNKYDNWYIGYTPYFIGGVWMGYEYPRELPDYEVNKCIQIWDEVMTKLHDNYIKSGEVKKFTISDKIVEREYCMDSGKLLTTACACDPRGDRRQTGYFTIGTEPNTPCDRHVLVEYDRNSGGIAVGDCPSENIEKIGLIYVIRNFPVQIYVSDAQYTWRDIGGHILPETAPTLPFYNNIFEENIFGGISYGYQQYNRTCKEHFNYFDWKKKQEE